MDCQSSPVKTTRKIIIKKKKTVKPVINAPIIEAPVPVIEAPAPVIEAPAPVAECDPSPYIKVVRLTEEQAITYMNGKSRNCVQRPDSPLNVATFLIKQMLNAEQALFFEKNPRADMSMHIKNKDMPKYERCKKIIDFYYNTMIPIINKTKEEGKNIFLHALVEFNNFIVNYNNQSSNSKTFGLWDRRYYNRIIKIVD
jgi:hypothetical protein